MGYNNVVMKRIYLDHAATTPLHSQALQKMLPYFQEGYGNPDSPHFEGRKGMAAVDFARDLLAEKLNAKPSEIYFTSGGTEADNWALRGGAYAMRAQGKNRVLISSIEHHAVIAAGERLRAEGFIVDYIPVNRQGIVEEETLEKMLDKDTGLVAVMTANNETGAIQPIAALCKRAHEYGALFFTDAVQAAAHLSIDTKALGVDMLAISAHKFYGPKGVGALYIKAGTKMQGLIVGGEQERGLRGGTTAVPLVVGMAEAFSLNEGGKSALKEKIAGLRAAFFAALGREGITVNGNEGGLEGILNLRVEGVPNVDLVYAADLEGVSVSAGAACASNSVKPSHVLLAMGLSEEEAKECVRISFGEGNEEADVAAAGKILRGIIDRLRKKI